MAGPFLGGGPVIRRFVWQRLRYEVGWWVVYEISDKTSARVWTPMPSARQTSRSRHAKSAHEDR